MNWLYLLAADPAVAAKAAEAVAETATDDTGGFPWWARAVTGVGAVGIAKMTYDFIASQRKLAIERGDKLANERLADLAGQLVESKASNLEFQGRLLEKTTKLEDCEKERAALLASQSKPLVSRKRGRK